MRHIVTNTRDLTYITKHVNLTLYGKPGGNQSTEVHWTMQLVMVKMAE